MLVDEVEIRIKAGDGGDGKVNFHREKFVPRGGPDGGDGGDGGDLYFVGVQDITALRQFRYEKEFAAEEGRRGDKNKKTGLSGKDLRIEIPVGTVIRDVDSNELWEIVKSGQEILIAKGGKGGKGNWHYRSSTHQTPLEYQEGGEGQKRNLFLELQLIADIGLIGLPSAGKSSLLNELTHASVKVAAYPFTTLEPNLGVTEGGLIIADLPGLIEGAHEGKGLGVKFLKHVRRTRILVHCVPADSPDILKSYKVIRKELGEYDKLLLERPEIVLITKADLVSEKQLKEIRGKFKGELKGKDILDCSVYDYESLEKLKKRLLSC